MNLALRKLIKMFPITEWSAHTITNPTKIIINMGLARIGKKTGDQRGSPTKKTTPAPSEAIVTKLKEEFIIVGRRSPALGRNRIRL